jgi:hypothetical protein
MVAFGEALDGALAQYFDKPQEQIAGRVTMSDISWEVCKRRGLAPLCELHGLPPWS